jgi:F0F1-type ATP synthase membrane subunit c/vacuolar-type H+-ATPase subunit K
MRKGAKYSLFQKAKGNSMQQSTRIQRLVVFLFFCASPFIFRMMIALLEQGQRPPASPNFASLRLTILVVAGLLLVVSALFSLLRLSPSLTPAQRQTNMIVALALAEAPCIFGLMLFMLGGTSADYNPLMIGTLLVNLIFIAPRALGD